MSSKQNLYITLQYLRTTNGKNKYHWGLWVTGKEPPAGYLIHATDANRAALDLYKETRKVSNPLKSKTMVACLKIADSPGAQVVDAAADAVGLMDRRYLPSSEPQWTCRVFVKQVLQRLHNKRHIELPMDVDGIESYCQYTADLCIQSGKRAKVYNDLSWMSSSSSSQTTPMDIDYTGGRYLGPSPMDTETYGQAYYGTSPMVTERGGGAYYSSSSAKTKPMVTETYRSSGRRNKYSGR